MLPVLGTWFKIRGCGPAKKTSQGVTEPMLQKTKCLPASALVLVVEYVVINTHHLYTDVVPKSVASTSITKRGSE